MADLNVTGSAAFDRIRSLDPDDAEALDMLQHLAFLAPSAVLAAADATERRRTPTAERAAEVEQARADERGRCVAELRRHSSERMDVGVQQVASGDDGGLAVVSYASTMDRAARLLESGELAHEPTGGGA